MGGSGEVARCVYTAGRERRLGSARARHSHGLPLSPVDSCRLPIFPEEAANTTALMELVGGGRHGEDGSASGSRVAVLGGFGIRSIGPGREETSVAAGGVSVSDFTESAGDNVDVIDHGCVEGPPVADQDAVFEERTDSGDAVSAQSAGKMDPQATGWTKSLQIGRHARRGSVHLSKLLGDMRVNLATM